MNLFYYILMVLIRFHLKKTICGYKRFLNCPYLSLKIESKKH